VEVSRAVSVFFARDYGCLFITNAKNGRVRKRQTLSGGGGGGGGGDTFSVIEQEREKRS